MTRPAAAICALLLLLLQAAACDRRPAEWLTSGGAEHPLTGRIWDSNAGTFITSAVLKERLAEARYVLLGEKHDNPDHQRLHALLVTAAQRPGAPRAVAMEMLLPEQAGALRAHLAARPDDAAGIGAAVGWAEAGWPDWTHYRPVAEAAVAAGAPIVPANLSRAELRSVLDEGLPGLGTERLRRLGLDRPPPEGLRETQAAIVRESHCGHAAEPLLSRMVAAQRARDAAMAEALIDAADGRGAVLVAGGGHVRRDIGVPVYLRQREPSAHIATIGYREVRDGETDPDRLALPFDYVWFTPRVDQQEVDPCERFRRPLRRLQRLRS